jgi:hypothetical protein
MLLCRGAAYLILSRSQVPSNTRFTSSGTRHPNETTQKAIRELFEGTFGALSD